METNELVIDESNFDDYFFDATKHRPQPGQVLAKFTAVATFGSGPHKRDVIHLLKVDKAKQAAAVMEKIHHAKVPDSYRVCRQICEDLLNGMSVDEVENKEYEYVFEMVYWTSRQFVPKNDPHWETLKIVDYDKESGKFSSRIEL